jgi:hypothetical protein
MRITSLLACALLSSRALAAFVIDDFSAGAVFLEGDTYNPGTRLAQSGLSPLHVLSGNRDLYAGSWGAVDLEISAATGEMRFKVLEDVGYFALSYTATAPHKFNLLADGDDAFLVEFSEIQNLDSGGLSIYLNGWNAQASLLNGFSFDPNLRSVRVPFSKFRNVDLSAVDEIRIEGFRINSSTVISIDSFSTVPEPSGALLGGAAGLVILGSRSRRQNQSR